MKYSTLYEAQIPTRKHRDVDLLEGVHVSDAMATDYDWVPSTMPLDTLVHEFQDSHHHGFVVKDENGELFGLVSLGDLNHALVTPSFEDLTVADIATTTGLATAFPDESMSSVLWRMGVRGVGRVPVVSRDNPRKLLGVIRRRDVITAYERAMTIRTETSYKLKELRSAHEGRIRVVDVDIERGHRFVGKSVREIASNIPQEAILVSVRRGKRLIIPHGDTILQDGDHLVLLAGESCADEAYASLSAR